jgi:hypothetical protein
VPVTLVALVALDELSPELFFPKELNEENSNTNTTTTTKKMIKTPGVKLKFLKKLENEFFIFPSPPCNNGKLYILLSLVS